MKLSIFAKKKAWHINQLLLAARKENILTNLIILKDTIQFKKYSKKIGDVIIWRNSFLNDADKISIQTALSTKPIINSSYIKHPLLPTKMFQQKYLADYKTINVIPTYYFKNVAELKRSIGEKINFPLIQKPNLGSRGEGIKLLKSFSDVEKDAFLREKFIFQPFIENDGDYRVLVLGGKVLGIIKRTAQEGGFLNNISQGGTALHVTDPVIIKPLSELALKIASIFDLSFCGIDIIFNKADSRYYFLELNTLPQWKGFQKATKINVAAKIIEHCALLAERKKLPTPTLVQNYFEKNYDFLDDKKFHYASRMFLWTKKTIYRERLAELEKNYIGKNEKDTKKIIEHTLQPKAVNDKDILRGTLRKPYFKKYPQLSSFNKVLFKSLFTETLYQKDLRPILENYLKKSTLLELRTNLLNDRRAIAVLSTYAVNFIYNSSHYLKDNDNIDPKLFLTIAQEGYTGNLKHCLDLKLYLLTHAIIGASKFYFGKITHHKETYLQMISLCEEIITKNYDAIPLDNKFEFLVCTRLLDYQSVIEKRILTEADTSLSAVGNFLVGHQNISKKNAGQNILDSEHRNVLFVMANSKYGKLSIKK